MGEVLPLNERLAAYRRLVRQHPELTVDDRERMFSMAVWPEATERRRVLTWEHLQNCRNKDCELCSVGELAA